MRAACRQLTDDADTEGDEAGRGDGWRLVDRLLAARHRVIVISLHARTVLAAVVTTRPPHRARAWRSTPTLNSSMPAIFMLN